MERIAFFGLGAMGEGVAANLLRAGYTVNITVHRSREATDRLAALGATLHQSKSDAAKASEYVILCLPNSNVVEETINEIWYELDERYLVVDTGTSSVRQSLQLAERLGSRGIQFAEAPLAGGKVQAAAGELGAFVGCSNQTFERVEPLLKNFCASVQHFGPVGSGSSAKLISNYLVLGMVRLITETFHAADSLEVDWAKFYEIIRQGSSNSMALERMIGSILEDDDYGGYVFTVRNALKDSSYIAELGESISQAVLGDAALKLFAEANELGFGDLQISELLRREVRHQLSELSSEKNSPC
ncbi:MAG: NAD(P)-dependent oxidoreductase [Gammaproteobacteria bacterium]|nr:NAD(P)-dependent oxidoreductase [Gammaproteobacteria bacterium]